MQQIWVEATVDTSCKDVFYIAIYVYMYYDLCCLAVYHLELFENLAPLLCDLKL